MFNGSHSEVIAIGNGTDRADIHCYALKGAPELLYRGSGGFVKNSVVACSGNIGDSIEQYMKCWILNSDKTIQLKASRALSASIVINQKVSTYLQWPKTSAHGNVAITMAMPPLRTKPFKSDLNMPKCLSFKAGILRFFLC